MTDHDNQDYEKPVVDSTNGDYDEPTATVENTTEEEQPATDAPAEEDAKAEEVKDLAGPAPSSSNTVLTFPVFVSIPKRMEKYLPLQLHARRFSTVSKSLNEWAQITDESEGNLHLAHYVNAFADATELSLGLTNHEEEVDGNVRYRGWFEDTLSNPDAEWRQGIINEKGELITPTRPNRNTNKQRVIEGSAAKERVLNAIGVGLGLRTPLPHTGLRVGFSSPTGADISALNYALQLERTRSGFATDGMVFSNVNYGRISKAWEFAQKYIVYTNLQGWVDYDLGDIIKCTDIPIIDWALSCTMFPDGHPLEVPCGNDPGICAHVEKINLDLFATLWFNNKGLDKRQVQMLDNSNTNYPYSAIEKYGQVENSNLAHKFTAKSSNGSTFEVVCKVPTINEYIRAGEEWVASADKIMDGIFDRSKTSPKARQKFIEEHTNLTALRGYSPWIGKIVINGLEEIVSEISICEALEGLSNDDELTGKILQEIQSFIERATVAVVAIPTIECSNCGFDATTDESSKHPELTPIDPFKLFFELGDRRLITRQAGLTT